MEPGDLLVYVNSWTTGVPVHVPFVNFGTTGVPVHVPLLNFIIAREPGNFFVETPY